MGWKSSGPRAFDPFILKIASLVSILDEHKLRIDVGKRELGVRSHTLWSEVYNVENNLDMSSFMSSSPVMRFLTLSRKQRIFFDDAGYRHFCERMKS